jgi:hypothetical protein
MDANNKDRVYKLVKDAYERLDRALYALKDGRDRVAQDELDNAISELKDAFRMM